MEFILLLVALVVGVESLSSLSRTTYDNAFDRQCGNDQAIYKLYSYHSNNKEDREWTFSCQTNYNLNDNNPAWTSYQNDWDRTLNYNCGTNKALVGISSYHSNNKEDRRFRFKCKSFNGVQTNNCGYTGEINNWDGTLSWSLSNTNQVINGLYSYHSNNKEDRRWKIYKCDLCSVSITWNNWGSWSSCPRTCTPVGGVASRQSRTQTARNNRPQPFCSSVNHATKTQQQDCNEKVPCPVPVAGSWGCWSGWSTCSNSCGIGTRTRTRSCDHRQNGGASCPGSSSQSEECTTSEFQVVANAGIQGNDRKVLTGKSSLECTRACLTESSFTCRSFDFQPSTGRCLLSDKSRSTASLTSGGDFTGWMYQEKKCGSNKATTVTLPTHSPFSDNCHTTNCYSACGESPYGNEIRTGDVITVRGINVDLYAKLKDGSIPSTAKIVKLYAQTVKLTRTLDISYDLVIVARQVYFSSAANMRFIKPLNSPLNIDRCYTQTLTQDCASGQKMTLVSYYGNGRVDIYAEGISGGRSCSSGRIIQHLPKQDLTSLRQAVTCSQILRTASSNGYSSVADNILKYVRLVSRDSSVFDSAAHATSIGSLASKIQGEMLVEHATGRRHLPVLSQSAYTSILTSYAAIYNTYDQKYTSVYDQRTATSTRLSDISAMMTQSQATVTLLEKKAQNAAAACEESTLTLEKLTDEFDKANSELEGAQKALEAGIEKYKREQIMKAVFGFINVIGALLKAVSQIVIGGLTGNVAMVVGGVGDLVATIAELAMLIQETIELAATIKDLKSLASDMKSQFSSLKAPANAEGVLQTVEEAADTRVKIVVWENIKNTADIQLGSGTITEIDGCSDFRKALADTANWGKALSEQVIVHSELTRAYILEALALEIARQDLARTTTLYNAAVSSSSMSNDLLAAVNHQIAEVQISGSRTMVSYCDTFYYYNFKKCGSDYTFKLSDRMHIFQTKIYQMANAQLYSAATFGHNPPHPFKAVHILKDTVTKDCNDPSKCPVTQLKLNRQITFKIPVTSPDLASRQRVRVQQIRVFLAGVSTNKRVSILLNNVGTVNDRYDGKTYAFSAVPRELVFTHNFVSGTTSDYACVHSSVSGVFFAATPFGDWGLNVLNPASDLNLSGLTQIEIYFLGSSIASRDAADYHPTLYHGLLGKASIAGSCIADSKKRRRRAAGRNIVNATMNRR